MAIPGTLVYVGANPISQAFYDELPNMKAVVQWLSDQAVEDIEQPPESLVIIIEHISHEVSASETGYEPGAIWFTGDSVDTDPIAEELATYGFDLYDQGSGKWYVFLPSDRTVV